MEALFLSDVNDLANSDGETGGRPELPPGSRGRVLGALEGILVSADLLREHVGTLQRVLGLELRHADPLPDEQIESVLAGGLDALDDAALAALALNPIALYDLSDELRARPLDKISEAWLAAMEQAGEALLRRYGSPPGPTGISMGILGSAGGRRRSLAAPWPPPRAPNELWHPSPSALGSWSVDPGPATASDPELRIHFDLHRCKHCLRVVERLRSMPSIARMFASACGTAREWLDPPPRPVMGFAGEPSSSEVRQFEIDGTRMTGSLYWGSSVGGDRSAVDLWVWLGDPDAPQGTLIRVHLLAADVPPVFVMLRDDFGVRAGKSRIPQASDMIDALPVVWRIDSAASLEEGEAGDLLRSFQRSRSDDPRSVDAWQDWARRQLESAVAHPGPIADSLRGILAEVQGGPQW